MARTILSVGALVTSVAAAACGAPADHGAPGSAECSNGADGLPTTLVCTGLYADAATETLAADVAPYDPSLSMWADGADKRRFIRLPPGTTIETSDVDHWVFPIGTKLWKEFSLGARKVETRYEEKLADGQWGRTTYVWSADQTSASEVTGGIPNVDGSGYEVPTKAECATCHRGAADGVLGFEAIGLSMPHATGLTMNELAQRGLVSHLPAVPLTIPGTATDASALAWLHANCGNACHNRNAGALARSTGLFMRLTSDRLDAVHDTDTYTTAVGVPSGFQPAAGATFARIAPRDVPHSAVPYRALARDNATQAGVQMPPIVSHVPDMAGVALVQAWINAM
jgi:hypothetical protein